MRLPNPIPHMCTYCEYRHSGGACTEEAVLKAYDSGYCKEFVLGKCLSCKLHSEKDPRCFNHQMAFDYCSCDRYTPNKKKKKRFACMKHWSRGISKDIHEINKLHKKVKNYSSFQCIDIIENVPDNDLYTYSLVYTVYKQRKENKKKKAYSRYRAYMVYLRKKGKK